MKGCLRYADWGRERLTERHIQAIWYDRDIRPTNIVTRTGETVRVINPGIWNLEAGPDFKDAVLEVGPERRRLKGDVEVHLTPADWTRHGHGMDPAFKNVIAHVTWGCGPEPQTLPLSAVSIWIGRVMTTNVMFAPEQIDLAAYPFARLPAGIRPCEKRFGDNPDLANAVLSQAGRHRLMTKARRIEQELAWTKRSRRQLFYEEVMTALGYKRNARGFKWIATIVPYDALMDDPRNAAAALTAAAGFVEWNRFGLRPHNTPETRLEAAAALFIREETIRLLEETDFSPKSCKAMIGVLAKGHLMGHGRAAAILANVLVPFALAERRLLAVPAWLPPEDLSEPVRLTAFRFFGRDHHPLVRYAKNGLLIQGLIQIHRDYCLQVHPDCTSCTLIEETADSSEPERHACGMW